MNNNWFVAGVAYIAAITALALGDVGQMPQCSTEPHDMWLPITALVLLATAFMLGYFGHD